MFRRWALDGVLLALGVDDEESLGQTLHVAGATEVGLELSELLAEHCLLLLGQHCHAAVLTMALSSSMRLMRERMVTKLVKVYRRANAG